MTKNGHNTEEDILLRELEGSLRALPGPEVPDGLEARLLNAIPAEPVRTLRPWRVRWHQKLLAGGIAAAVALVCVKLLPDLATDGSPGTSEVSDYTSTIADTGGSTTPGGLADTSPAYIIEPAFIVSSEDTKPCNILPPQSS